MGSCSSVPEDLRDKYTIRNRVGIGSFSVVKKAVRLQDKREFAIKIIDKRSLEANELKMAVQEAKILSDIRGDPHIVKLEETYETPTQIYIVLQFLKGGSLLDHINTTTDFSERNVSGIVADISSALGYLHKKGIAHRDLKSENLMFENTNDPTSIKVTDFGMASYISPDKPMNTICGSPGYIAPEALDGGPYDEAVDMWSLGIILYIMLCGFVPFHGQDPKQLFKAILSGFVEFPGAFWGSISDDAKDLVSKLLAIDPKERYTAEQVLKHPFVVDCSDLSDTPFDPSYMTRIVLLGDSWRATSDFFAKLKARHNSS